MKPLADILTSEILDKITAHYQKFTGSSGKVTLKGDCLHFDHPEAHTFDRGSSFGGHPSPRVYVYNIVQRRDVNGRPGDWYDLDRLFWDLRIYNDTREHFYAYLEHLAE
jgi:hypothetical protein